MKLAALLSIVSEADLDKLASEHVRTDEKLAKPQLCNFLEGAIKSYRYLSGFIINRQPPAFSILTNILQSPGFERSLVGLEQAAMEATARIAGLVDQEEILSGDRDLYLYRRALYEARRNDLDVNDSEAAILAVLRREIGISQVEHYLIEHHRDFREFWDRDGCFQHELRALQTAGIIFIANECAFIPEDVAPAVWQALGIDMPVESARRLYSYLSNAELGDILAAAGSRTSGSKETRLERVISEWVQPHSALQSVSLQTLKDICRQTDAPTSGNKEDIIERIVAHFAVGRDQQEEERPPEHQPEVRQLGQEQFELLFGSLTQVELSDILRCRPELRQSGTKDARVRTLWDAQISEANLLGHLMNWQLEDVLHRLGLRISGAKATRIDRLIGHFTMAGPALGQAAPLAADEIPHEPATTPVSADVRENQLAFRQRAVSPGTALQPWLDTLISSGGALRCYATEDQNPTKQLKNKLAQAAAARDGTLLLLLADSDAFLKAREALVERWMSNDEWSKSVICVALAYPTLDPSIHAVIERAANPWSKRLTELLFPDAEVIRVESKAGAASMHCGTCGAVAASSAKYCSQCGHPI